MMVVVHGGGHSDIPFISIQPGLSVLKLNLMIFFGELVPVRSIKNAQNREGIQIGSVYCA